MALLGLYALLMVLWIWLVVKGFKEGAGWGIITILFWPAAIVLLFRNWGAENDVKIPYILLAIVTVITVMKAQTAMAELAAAEQEDNNPAITAPGGSSQ